MAFYLDLSRAGGEEVNQKYLRVISGIKKVEMVAGGPASSRLVSGRVSELAKTKQGPGGFNPQ